MTAATKSSAKKSKTTKPKAAAAKKDKAETVKTEPKIASPIKANKTKEPKKSLYDWNRGFGVALLLLAIAVLVIGNASSEPVTTQYLAKDELASAIGGKSVLAPAIRHLFDVPLSWMVAGFLSTFGVIYLLAATLVRTKYEAWLDRGVNNLRWLGFGLGGGLIIATISMLSGVSDISTLGLIFGSVLIASFLALAVEDLGAARQLRRMLAGGAILLLFLTWLIFVRSSGAVFMYDGSLPTYLYYLYASATLLLVAVCTALYLRVEKRGRWSDTFYTEKMFMGLGFVVASLLALQVFAGALQP
jgi:hypothetical protein